MHSNLVSVYDVIDILYCLYMAERLEVISIVLMHVQVYVRVHLPLNEGDA